jgi:hypothetical protein
VSASAMPVHVALIADPAVVDPHLLSEVAGALNEQVQSDFAPVWHVRATVGAYPAGGGYGTWNVQVLADINEPGTLGYHSDEHNVPYAVVQHDDNWPITASHEVLEMLADPFGSRMHTARLPFGLNLDYARFGLDHGSSRVHYLVEACDPCENGAYEVGGVTLSDFLLPSWYRTNPKLAATYSHTGTCAAPREVAPGGYVSFSNSSGEWFQVYADASGRLTYQSLGKFSREFASLREFTDHHARAGRESTEPLS